MGLLSDSWQFYVSTPAESVNTEPPLLRASEGGVVTLTLNRPAQFNALSESMLDALSAAIDDIESDESVRVVVIAANGNAFCTGHDLKQMHSNRAEAYYRALFSKSSELMLKLLHLPQPVIARVQGIAAANGCNLVATCDLAVASKQAKFAVSGVNYGLFCSTPSVGLARNVSRKRAFEMLVTGDFIDADTALAYGLVNRVAPEEKLDEEVNDLCRSVISKSRVAIATGKRMFYAQVEKGVKDAYDLATKAMTGNMMSEDAAEGVDAFVQKRSPKWNGK